MTGQFTGGCSLRPTDDPGVYLYCPDTGAPLTFTRPDGRRITLAWEFDTDGASVPRPLRLTKWLDPFGSLIRAAIVHDWLWELRYSGRLEFGFVGSNRVLREAAVACGLRRWQAWVVWAAVTVGGWPWWIRGERGTDE